jgi:hypothetical protein
MDDISVREDRGSRLLYSEAIFDRDKRFFSPLIDLYTHKLFLMSCVGRLLAAFGSRATRLDLPMGELAIRYRSRPGPQFFANWIVG